MRKEYGDIIFYDWTISRTCEITDEDFKFICDDYVEYIKTMPETEAWWEGISTFLMNQDIDFNEIPYVIVAQIIKDCKKFFEKHYKNA